MKYLLTCVLLYCSSISAQKSNMMIRIAEIEIDAKYTKTYQAILQEEANASVLAEPGVIAIYPLYQKDNPTQVRILEIYANREAYELHLKSAHFLKYKTSTQAMVKSLKLVEMENIDAAGMVEIFRKMKP